MPATAQKNEDAPLMRPGTLKDGTRRERGAQKLPGVARRRELYQSLNTLADDKDPLAIGILLILSEFKLNQKGNTKL